MGSTLVEQHLPSATHSTRPYQSAVAQSAQSLRVSQRLHQSAGKESVDSMALDPSQQPQLATPSPESSSTSTNSGSGSSKSADTVKRGISPTFLTSSLSSSKIRDSNSSFAINTSNNLDGVADTKESYTRGKNTNTTSSKNVLFATDADKSPSSFASNELTNFINLNAIQPTSTSTLIKQTLSPLVHHRKTNNASNILNESKNAANQLKTKLKTGSTSIKNYHLSSNTFIMDNNDDDGGSGGGIHDDNDDRSNFLLSASTNTSNTTIKKTLSPSKSLINHTNMLPSQVARSNNIQYQFESNCLPKNKANNIASPGSTLFNALSSISASNAPVTLSSQTSIAIPASTTATISNNSYPSNNIYGTLPKTTNPSSSGTIYGNVTAVANEFEQLIARNACNNTITNTTTNHTNYHTLGSYRIQYSSTNPFLNNFNSKSSE
ncbi:rho GTPase-activating protein 100F-like isoform X1 [Sitodiplosis mosellana]|uniref:rho GTPase-activating protein 100F-like isoform X1 n=1 Tax=Sitodiplosis mosellana TaxID=263140 RepID=UPI0024444DAD|nr:rho GTPase-activating protein 100F-like isoform X1 [Sitodiplosis mosellana]